MLILTGVGRSVTEPARVLYLAESARLQNPNTRGVNVYQARNAVGESRRSTDRDGR